MTSLRALVLAGSRAGERDPVAAAAGVPHKVLAPVGGEPMILRVLSALRSCHRIGELIVVTDIAEALRGLAAIRELERSGRLLLRPAKTSLSRSVAAVCAEFGPPLLVTTGDHALLDRRILTQFLERAEVDSADLAVGLVEERVIQAAVPTTRRTYMRFRDLAVSGANLFLLRTRRAANAVEFWRRVEAERKRPWRLAAAFGPRLLLGFILRRLTLGRAFDLAGARIGAAVAPVLLPVPEAAIDVDRPDDLRLAEELVLRRSAVESTR